MPLTGAAALCGLSRGYQRTRTDLLLRKIYRSGLHIVQSKALAPRGGASPEGVDGRIENDKRTGAAEASEAIFRSKRFGAWEDGGAGRLMAMLFKDWSASRDDRETEINVC
ncbi:uncharacterized protein IUM83_03714 [Phytophthora cinnamomi]|uniref:uncharacterized protein n=1 Tax=Phytophthora cinnamomi TaxID=4785 RepID=UPI00355967C9|nr:hypothetical protein IUM83_03714 [Phytophthora cinnamomi]